MLMSNFTIQHSTACGRKERTYDVLSIQRENGNGTKKYSAKETCPKKQKKEKQKEEAKTKKDADIG